MTVRGELRNRARHQGPDDPVADAVERILDVALAELLAALVRRAADGQLQRAVDGFHHFGHRDGVGRP